MELILLLVLFGVLGYLLARSRAGKQIDETASKLTDQAVDFTGKSSDWVDERLGRKPANSFRTWATTAEYVPADLRDWAASLSDEKAAAFDKALKNHADSMDMDLNQLFSGALDGQPDKQKVYVEAVSVYSQAYRKAKEVKQEEAAQDPEVMEGEVVEGKTVAEKSSSRRKRDSDTAEEPA